jgi:CheY-like chemotaxis protein
VNSILRILHLEDDPRDADLVQAKLEAEGLDCRVTRVETDAEFRAALGEDGFQLILADYTLPSFDGISALKIAVTQRPEAPFIFVSGTLDEEVAIEMLKMGATDYVFKTRLSRIFPAMQRALREGRERAERKRAEALLAGEKRLLEMIATGVPLKEILNSLCLIIEEQCPGTLASVLLLNSDGVHLDVIAGPSLTNEWTHQMEKLPIGPCAGSCGTAAYRGTPVIVSDIATDPLWEVPEHRAAALSNGLRASWSNPILSSEGKVLGTFCIYDREMRSPSSHDLRLIEMATHLAGVAIERDRAEEAFSLMVRESATPEAGDGIFPPGRSSGRMNNPGCLVLTSLKLNRRSSCSSKGSIRKIERGSNKSSTTQRTNGASTRWNIVSSFPINRLSTSNPSVVPL